MFLHVDSDFVEQKPEAPRIFNIKCGGFRIAGRMIVRNDYCIRFCASAISTIRLNENGVSELFPRPTISL